MAAGNNRVSILNPIYNAVVSRASEHTSHSGAPETAPFYGLPVLVKEVVNVSNFATTLCDPSLKSSFVSEIFTKAKTSEEEAGLVSVIKSLGANVIGKTNIPLKGLDVQCDNPVCGITKNPFDFSRTCGGSSGGSAVSVATGMVPLSIGTDLGGSLRIPAAFCGVTSMRCSYGRLPNSGHVPPAPPSGNAEAESSIQIGPIANDIGSLQTFLHYVSNSESSPEGLDLNGDPGGHPPLKTTCDTTIGISSCVGGFPVDARVKDFLEQSFATSVSSEGINVVDVHDQANEIDLKAVNKAYVTFSQGLFVEMKGKSNQKRLDKAVELREELRNQVDSIFENLSCDAWVLPVTPTGFAFPNNPQKGRIDILGANGDAKPTSYWPAVLSYVLPFTVTGHPVVTMPVGMVNIKGVKLPVGVQVIGRRGGDDALLDTCRVLEEALGTVVEQPFRKIKLPEHDLW